MTKELREASCDPTLLNECWNRIGVMGDRSCPELERSVHCRNCPVFVAAGQQLFEREPPAEYLEECTRQLTEEVSEEVADTMADYWTNFAKLLDPNGEGLASWPVYDPNDEYWLNIGDTVRLERFNSAGVDLIAEQQEEIRRER